MSEPETPEQIAERLAGPVRDLGGTEIPSRARKRDLILAALREVEARGEQRAAKLGGALLDSAVERAEKAEAEIEHLKAVEADSLYE